MERNSKFKNGETVCFLNEKGKCERDEIICVVHFSWADGRESVLYELKHHSSMHEEKLFATEAELKKYVFTDLIEFA